MDLSKMPRMSKTERPAEQTEAAPSAAEVPAEARRAESPPVAGTGAEAWISIAVGVIVLLIQRNLVTWVLSKMGLADPPLPFWNPEAGRFDVPYEQTANFFHDIGLGLFGLALIVEGIVLLIRNQALMWAALGLMLLATGWNVVTVVGSYADYGLQLWPALAVAFGVYIAIHQWRVLRAAGGRE